MVNQLQLKSFRYSRTVLIICLGLLFLFLPFSVGQDIPVTPVLENDNEHDIINPLRITVGVNEVRLDVVVVDSRGRQITDLTADDFEVYQDKIPQDVTSVVYISNQSEADVQPFASRKDAPNLLPSSVPSTTLKEEEVSRSILFVVDNLSLPPVNMYYAKMGINRFLEKQMQPGDMVSVMATGSGNSILNMFSSDKRQISLRTDAIPWNVALPDGCNGDFGSIIYDNQISTLSYSIRAMKDMPGRKILFFKTGCPFIASPFDNFTTPLEGGGSEITPESERKKRYFREMFDKDFTRLAEEALRAGVVINFLDPRGLEVEPNPNDFGAALNPLPARTGGILVTNSNFFLDGIGKEANNMIAGYYLVSYTPPESTFKSGNKNEYHRMTVKVNRKGAVVHTRDGFYGKPESETDSDTQRHPLHYAIFSPFRYADLNVNMAAGYIKGPRNDYVFPAAGSRAVTDYPDYLVRAWIHLDSKDVKIVETEDGGARIDLETMILTSDISGNVHDSRLVQYTYNLEPRKKSENIAWIQENGLRFSLMLPVKKPGYYTVHVAVRDTESGKIGSAYQFIDIPDLKKKGLAMSNIFMITSGDDLAWMRSDVIKELAKGAFFPMLYQDDGVRSPALRTYARGDSLQTLTMIYNTDSKALARSEIEIKSILYKGGAEILGGEPMPVTPGNEVTTEGISILRNFTMGTDIQPGDYLLQLLVTDKKNSEKRDEQGVAPKEPGLLKKILRAYINEPEDYRYLNKNKGVASQVLSFTITEE